VQSGPAAPELAADANDCIMVRSSNRSTEYKAVARDQRNTNGELASGFHRRLQLAVSHVTSNQVGSAMLRPTGVPDSRTSDADVCRPKPTHPAVVLAAVKDAARR
jgi:hypothetical protein